MAQLRGGYFACAGASIGVKAYRAANIATRNTLNISQNSASMGSKGAANKLLGAANSYFGGANKATGIQLATAGVLYSTSYLHLNTISSNQGQRSHGGG